MRNFQRFVAMLLLMAASLVQAQQLLTIRITQGADDPVRIAIVPFEWTGFGALPESITDIVNNDLRNSGIFAPLEERNFLGQPHQQSEVFFRDWNVLGAQYLLIGRIMQSPNSDLMQVQYELFDVNRQARMVGEVISGTQGQLRDIAHQISDVVYEQVTGIRGAFSTKLLYITSQRASDTVTNYQLNMSDADGARAQVLLESQQPIMSPTWSPDATQISYSSFESGRPAIFVQTLATGERIQLTDFPMQNASPVWSPDGTRMAMVLSKDGNADVYVMDLRTRELRKVTTHFAAEVEPSWTPDGRSLLYTSEQSGNNRPQIYRVDLDTNFSERITFEGIYNSKARMLEDGQNIVLVHRYDTSDDFHIAIMNLERGTIRTLTNTALDESPTIAPNASMIMYASKENGRGVLNAVSIDGRVKFQLPVASGDVREPSWSPFLD
ncbi:MAG TPA: Tol-Pal system beta propeller repeat protein TolB [Pseudomonadales bacterium]